MPSDGDAALMAVRASGGTMVAVEDDAILGSLKTLAESEGIFAEPSAAASLAGLEQLTREKFFDRRDRVVVLITGNGLKDVETALTVTGQATTVAPRLEEVLKMLRIE
jgi:threonine synthase